MACRNLSYLIDPNTSLKSTSCARASSRHSLHLWPTTRMASKWASPPTLVNPSAVSYPGAKASHCSTTKALLTTTCPGMDGAIGL